MSEAFRKDMMRVRKHLAIAEKISPVNAVAITGALDDVYQSARQEENEACDKILRHQWHVAVVEFGLTPGSPVEKFPANALNAIRHRLKDNEGKG